MKAQVGLGWVGLVEWKNQSNSIRLNKEETRRSFIDWSLDLFLLNLYYLILDHHISWITKRQTSSSFYKIHNFMLNIFFNLEYFFLTFSIFFFFNCFFFKCSKYFNPIKNIIIITNNIFMYCAFYLVRFLYFILL